jgi:GNAT superfamily N-acetyltransferase
MVELLQSLFRIERDFQCDVAKQRRGLAMLLQRPSQSYALVAEVEGKPIGMCLVQIVISTAEGGEVGLLEDMVIAPAWRGKGVGKRLLQSIVDWSHGRGLLRLQLLTDRENAAALGFYAAGGWSPTQLTALRRMAPP